MNGTEKEIQIKLLNHLYWIELLFCFPPDDLNQPLIDNEREVVKIKFKHSINCSIPYVLINDDFYCTQDKRNSSPHNCESPQSLVPILLPRAQNWWIYQTFVIFSLRTKKIIQRNFKDDIFRRFQNFQLLDYIRKRANSLTSKIFSLIAILLEKITQTTSFLIWSEASLN